MQTQEITVKDIIEIIYNKKWIIIISFLFFLTGGILTSKYMKKIYKSSSKILIGEYQDYKDANMQDIARDQKLYDTYSQIMQSNEILSEVTKALNLKSFNFKKNLSVQTLVGTQLISITVKANSPELAFNINNELLNQFKIFVAKNFKIDNVIVVDVPKIDKKSVFPSTKRFIILSSILGILFGIFLILLLEYFDDKIKYFESLSKEFNVDILGKVFNNKNREKDQKFIRKTYDSFEIIKTNINLAQLDKKAKVVCFSSSLPSEGKTTTLTNYANILSNSNEKILIIDADIRKPRIHQAYNISNLNGLSNFIMGDIGNVVIKSDKNIDIITSGPGVSNPVKLLDSKKFANLIVSLKKKYDKILIDSPPILGMADTIVLSKVVDGLVLVCEHNKIKYSLITEVLDNLKKADINLLGLIINKVPLKKKNGYYYYYYSNDKKKK